jgi:hypothetical protein
MPKFNERYPHDRAVLTAAARLKQEDMERALRRAPMLSPAMAKLTEVRDAGRQRNFSRLLELAEESGDLVREFGGVA